MLDSSSASLLDELNTKNRLARMWPGALSLGLVVAFLLYKERGPLWPVGLAFGATGVATALAYWKDELRKSVVLLYDLEREVEAAFEKVCDDFNSLAHSARAWHIQASGAVRDQKYEAGASSLVNRKGASFAKNAPPYVKTNIHVPTISLTRAKLYFFPDRLLVYGADGVGAVSYKNLQLEVSPSRFIEAEGVPGDTQVVGQTWQYVNKDGGPDRRFKNNRQIPVVLYEALHFKSDSGLNELLQVSRVGVGEKFREALQGLGHVSQK